MRSRRRGEERRGEEGKREEREKEKEEEGKEEREKEKREREREKEQRGETGEEVRLTHIHSLSHAVATLQHDRPHSLLCVPSFPLLPLLCHSVASAVRIG